MRSIPADPFLSAPVLDPAEGIETLAVPVRREQEATVLLIALGLAWLRANLPPRPCQTRGGPWRFSHRQPDGPSKGRLSGVLDWELAHLGDGSRGSGVRLHDRVAFRAARQAGLRPRLDVETISPAPMRRLAAGRFEPCPVPLLAGLSHRVVGARLPVDGAGVAQRRRPARSNASSSPGAAAEQELDLVLLLEAKRPKRSVHRPLPSVPAPARPPADGRAVRSARCCTAVSEWLAATVKPAMAKAGNGSNSRWRKTRLASSRRDLNAARAAARGQARLQRRDLLAGTTDTRHSPACSQELRRRVLSTLCRRYAQIPGAWQRRAPSGGRNQG